MRRMGSGGRCGRIRIPDRRILGSPTARFAAQPLPSPIASVWLPASTIQGPAHG
ncbi:hypothetical protein C2845_PM01G30450 [Panicum miliaceum]|uniref:Uncharacterized protein n=1 Tax=Panicum miliaceum TaxID=4540 RepID=A0A3L6TSI3_PANMI|nr:hypothetical protein C2845_PM01G30450 [Panicum miliaceum]